MEKWDLAARCLDDSTTICCAIARNPMCPATMPEWRIEELYD
jgi:hypothetical protein